MFDVNEILDSLNISIFDAIPSQTTDDDKRSLLAIQSAVREFCPHYVYLEIGSHLGGSILPHLTDDLCSKIYSIDKRPLVQPDERGVSYGYPENSTQRMLSILSQVSSTEKIITIDGETSSLDASVVTEQPNLCFIDGEHTDVATEQDFKFCLGLLSSGGGGDHLPRCLRHL